ncbi:MAG: HK97 gp10 family phage protein [Candidatus Tenebribacter davisii]|nr:HK97 gp10 family phage protein [Candidatus Tenebribacter davisii]
MANTFADLFKFLDSVPEDIRVKIKRVFSKTKSDLLLSELRAHSPVFTGRYRDAWRVDRARFTDGSVIAGLRIYNETPYAEAMEYGAGIGGSPWPWYPRVRTGKLVEFEGKVWAGGLDPGGKKSLGGAIYRVSAKHRDFRALTKEIADAVVKGW